MKIHIIRNNQRYGPYDEKTLLAYVNQGQILIQDKAIKDGDTVEQTVGFYLKTAGLKTEVANKGYIISQLKAIGSELIFPKTTMLSKNSTYIQYLWVRQQSDLSNKTVIYVPTETNLPILESTRMNQAGSNSVQP